MCNLPLRVAYRTDTLFHVIQLPVLLSVYQDAAIDIAGENRRPHFLVNLRSLFAGFENARSSAARFVMAVTGERFERRVYILDNSVAVGHDYRVGGLFHCSRQFPHRLFRVLPLLLQRVHGHRIPDAADQGRSVQLRLGHAFPRLAPNKFRNSFLIRIFGQQDKGHRDSRMKKVGYQMDGLRVPGFVFKQNQAIGSLLQHLLRFRQRVGMIEVRSEYIAAPLQNFANQEEVFLFVAH